MSSGNGNLKVVTGHAEPEQVEWSERLEIGVPLIDGQHRQFFELATRLSGDGNQVRVMSSLALLSRYVKVHFRDEEALMAAYNYPGIETHRQLHQEFRFMLADMLERSRKMTLDQIAEEVARLVSGWLHLHILTVDLEYVPHVRKAQRRGAGDGHAR